MVKAFVCGAKDYRFESGLSPIYYLFNKRPSHLMVRIFAFHADNAGSIPVWVIYNNILSIGQMTEWFKVVVLKTIKYLYISWVRIPFCPIIIIKFYINFRVRISVRVV